MENFVVRIITFLLGSFLASVLYKLVRAATSPLKHLPGPPAARFTKLWYFKNIWNETFPWLNISLHQKYGKIVRIAPNEYSIDDPEAVKQILGSTIKWNKGPWYSGWGAPPQQKFYRDLFSRQDAQDHAAARRLVASLYSMSKLTQMEDRVDEAIDLLISKFEKFASSQQVFDLQLWMQCYATDVVHALTLDKRFGFLDKGDSEGFFDFLEMSNKMQTLGGVYPNAIYIVKAVLGILPSPFQELQDMIGKRIGAEKETFDNSGDSSGFIHGLLDVHKKHPSEFPEGGIETNVMVNLGAGSDTTSLSLSMILYYLMRTPRAMQKLREEIMANNRSSAHFTFQEAQKLSYMQAVIHEAIRLHAATGLPMSRVVPDEGATIAGQYFPAGTIVGINSWVAHYNPEVFGADASDFRPERWLESEGEALKKMDSYFLGFGSGARTCIGKNISMLEMTKVIPELVTRFDFNLVNPQMKVETDGCWFVKPKNLMVKINLRK